MGISPVDRNQFDNVQNRILGTYKELSSGKKNAEPSEKAQADRLDAASRGLSVALRNLDAARGTIDVAQGGLDVTNERLTRIRELTLQYRNTTNEDDRETIEQEIESELAQIDQIAAGKYEGKQPLKSSEPYTVQVGDDAQDTIDFASVDASTQALGLSGFDPGSDEALADLDAAAGKVQVAQSQFAATERRFGSVEGTLMHRIESSEAARSRIEDVDVAQAVARKTRDEILQRGQVAILAQSNRDSGSSFLRLLREGSRPQI